jgi:hypothetical protein
VLPSDYAVLYVYFPPAGTGTVNTVGGIYKFVVTKPVAIKVFPFPTLFGEGHLPVGKSLFGNQVLEPPKEIRHFPPHMTPLTQILVYETR